MRKAFIEALVRHAEADEKVWLVTGDLGFSVLEVFRDKFPDRYLNAGVAEQNMMGVAAGLALDGKTVFVYSIANFPLLRPYEQLRNDVCYHQLNVKVVAVGGGLAYGSAGYSHHGVEDLAVARVLPNLRVFAPGDPVETKLCVAELVRTPGPAYLRLGKGGEPAVHQSEPVLTVGQPLRLRAGTSVTICSTGAVLGLCVAAADELARQGVSAEVLSVPTLVPLDAEAVLTSVRATGRLLCVEEHGEGGLTSVLAEVLAGAGLGARFGSLRLPKQPIKVAGTQDALRASVGLTSAGVVELARRLLAA